MLARRSSFAPALSALLLACGHEETAPPWPLPRVVAAGEYIEYGTWADDTSVCMGDVLARMDRHIESTAEFLGVEPPATKIRYTWVPASLKAADTWACDDPEFFLLGCYLRHEEDSYVFADTFDNTHELVHAVDISANGTAHRVFKEGIAEYLGQPYNTTGMIEDFPTRFHVMVDRGGRPDYVLSLHFVGSIIERDGIEKYKELRATVPFGAGFADFAAAYLAVYGQDLDEALAEMTTPIYTRTKAPPFCQGEPVSWVGGPGLEVKLRGACGDGFFFGGGLVDGQPGFYKAFTIDVPAKGLYEMTLTGPADTLDQIAGYMVSCPGVEAGTVTSIRGSSSKGILHPGRHRIGVNFPHAPEPAGELTLTLRYEAPPPAQPPGPGLE